MWSTPLGTGEEGTCPKPQWCSRAGVGLSPLTSLLYQASHLCEDGSNLDKINWIRHLKDYCFKLWT